MGGPLFFNNRKRTQHPREGPSHSILQVCRQLRQDAEDVLYEDTVFIAEISLSRSHLYTDCELWVPGSILCRIRYLVLVVKHSQGH